MAYIGKQPTPVPLTSEDIADGTITNTDIAADAAISQAKLATLSITDSNIVDGAISQAKLATLSITDSNIANGTISQSKLATLSITDSNIADGAISQSKLNLSLSTSDISGDAANLGSGAAINGYVLLSDGSGGSTWGWQSFVDDAFRAKSYQETYTSVTGAINCTLGNLFSLSMSGNTTISFSNPPTSGIGYGMVLEVTGDGNSITWPTVRWPSGTAPAAPAASEISVYVFYTRDAGTNWTGFVAGTQIS